MKKRLLSLALALSLCMGLCVPALAADVSGLDAATAAAYYGELSQLVEKSGIRNSKDGHGIAFADVLDMDKDGTPELVVINAVETNSLLNLRFGIWKKQGGTVKQTVDHYLNGNPNDTVKYDTETLQVAYARKDGQTRLFIDWDNRYGNSRTMLDDGTWALITYQNHFYRFLSADGTLDEKQFSTGVSDENYQSADYDRSWKVDANPLITYRDSTLSYSDAQPKAVQATLDSLKKQISKTTPAPAAGTYGPYTIKGTFANNPYTISFSSAKVERKDVQIREYDDIDGEYSSYQTNTVTLVTIGPDTKVQVSGGSYGMVGVQSILDYNGKQYTVLVMGAVEDIHTGTGAEAFTANELPGGSNHVYLDSGIEKYIIAFDSNYTSSGFTDVPANSPFKNAIDWAVEKKITAGTSKTTFSPNSPCTHNHILTFLWRANGSPAATGKNDFEKAASWAKSKGLISGSYNGDKACTRAEAMTYLWKLAGSPKAATESYKPLTMKETDSDGITCTITFPAASTKKGSVRLCEDEIAEYYGGGDIVIGHHLNPDDTPCTIITVPAGSEVKVSYPTTVLMYENGVESSRYHPDAKGVYHCEPASSSVIRDGNTVDMTDYFGERYAELFFFNGETYFLIASAASSSFSDVPASASYAQAVAWAVAQGITSGTSKTTFSPNTVCTRGQIVTFLYRAMGK